MRASIVLRPEAENDLVPAMEWCEGRQSGLGGSFVDEVAAVLERIAEAPEAFPVAIRDVRKGRLRRFPYLIYYRDQTDRIEVIAVLHGSRNPAEWKRRA